MGRRTLIEALHLAIGLLATGVIAWVSIWGVPGARVPIVWTAVACAVAVVLMSVGPLRDARRADRGGSTHG